MKLPISWIKEYVEINETPERLASDLQLSGTKVDSIEKIGGDFIFDFEITPNRADCLSVIGIAREISAIYDRELTTPEPFSILKIKEEKKSISFSVEDLQLCPSYSVGVIDSVKVGPSPDWLAQRLERSGVRSINNIVDISNYVMTETGQPMHMFDFNKISGSMSLRATKKGDKIRTLDAVERELPNGSIIIEDDEKIIDLAGLMGGENSEVDKNTDALVLHVPLYNPITIRRTSSYLGLRTEASNRFEKQLDPAAHRYAFERATQLISTLAGGQLVSQIKSVGYPAKERVITTPISLIKQTLGIPISKIEIEKILGRLEFGTKQTSERTDSIGIVVPSFRTDVNEPIDITEEIGRIYGYDKFPKTLPAGTPSFSNLQQTNFEKDLKQIVASLGLKEIYSSSLTSASTLESLGISAETVLKVTNRLVTDYEYLRPSLLVGLIQASSLNIEHHRQFSFFEIGKTFEKSSKPSKLPNQPKKVAAIFIGFSYSTAKGVFEALLNKLNISNLTYKKVGRGAVFNESASEVYFEKKNLGVFGELDKETMSRFDVTALTFGFELGFETLQNCRREPFYKPRPKFPTVREDFSLFLPKSISYDAVTDSIERGAGGNFYKLELLEDTVVEGKRSILIEVEYYDPKGTLAADAINTIRNGVNKELRSLGAQIRE